MNSQTKTVDGIPMRYLEQGSGPPVVFIHGIPTGPALWRHVIPLIKQGRCFAWEMVGYGDSMPAGAGRDISVARQADYLVAWMQAMAIDQAVLVGHDLGGGVAQIAAVRHPDRVQGLVLMNSICYDSWPIPRVKLMRFFGSVIERFPHWLLWPAFAQLIYQGHDNRNGARESLGVHWRYYKEHGGGRALIRQIRALDTKDTLAVADRLPGLGLAARLVWGGADEFQKIEYGERLSGDLGAPLDLIVGGKHFVPEDHPERVAEAIEGLLRESKAA